MLDIFNVGVNALIYILSELAQTVSGCPDLNSRLSEQFAASEGYTTDVEVCDEIADHMIVGVRLLFVAPRHHADGLAWGDSSTIFVLVPNHDAACGN